MEEASLSLLLTQLSCKVTSLEETVQRLGAEKQSAGEEVRRLQEAVEASETTSRQQQLLWRKKVEEFQDEQRKLRLQLQMLMQENKELQTSLNTHKNEISCLLDARNEESAKLRSQNYSINKQLEDKNQNCDALQAQLKSQASLVEALEIELKALRTSVNEVKSLVTNQNKELSVHQSKIKEGMNCRELLLERIKSQQDKLHKAKLELIEAKERERTNSEKRHELETNMLSAKQLLSVESEERCRVEGILMDKIQEKKKLEDALQNEENVINTLRASLLEQNTKMEELRKLVQESQTVNPHLQTPIVQRGRDYTSISPVFSNQQCQKNVGCSPSAFNTPQRDDALDGGDCDLTPSHYTTPHTAYPSDMMTPGAPIRTRGTSLAGQEARVTAGCGKKLSNEAWEAVLESESGDVNASAGSSKLLNTRKEPGMLELIKDFDITNPGHKSAERNQGPNSRQDSGDAKESSLTCEDTGLKCSESAIRNLPKQELRGPSSKHQGDTETFYNKASCGSHSVPMESGPVSDQDQLSLPTQTNISEPSLASKCAEGHKTIQDSIDEKENYWQDGVVHSNTKTSVSEQLEQNWSCNPSNNLAPLSTPVSVPLPTTQVGVERHLKSDLPVKASVLLSAKTGGKSMFGRTDVDEVSTIIDFTEDQTFGKVSLSSKKDETKIKLQSAARELGASRIPIHPQASMFKMSRKRPHEDLEDQRASKIPKPVPNSDISNASYINQILTMQDPALQHCDEAGATKPGQNDPIVCKGSGLEGLFESLKEG